MWRNKGATQTQREIWQSLEGKPILSKYYLDLLQY